MSPTAVTFLGATWPLLSLIFVALAQILIVTGSKYVPWAFYAAAAAVPAIYFVALARCMAAVKLLEVAR